MNSHRQQPPEYVGKNGRIIFNSIGQSASRFCVYGDEPAFPHMRAKPLEPRYTYDPAKGPQWPSHVNDFLQCVRTGEQPRCHIDEAFIEVITYLMSVVSYREQRLVRWNAEKEEIA